VYYLLFKVAKPVPFAFILVFVDSNWIAILSVPCLFVGYFCLQMIIGAKQSYSTFMVFITASFYFSGLLFLEPNSIPRNLVGWYFIALLTVFMYAVGVKHLSEQIRYIKQVCIGKFS